MSPTKALISSTPTHLVFPQLDVGVRSRFGRFLQSCWSLSTLVKILLPLFSMTFSLCSGKNQLSAVSPQLSAKPFIPEDRSGPEVAWHRVGPDLPCPPAACDFSIAVLCFHRHSRFVPAILVAPTFISALWPSSSAMLT